VRLHGGASERLRRRSSRRLDDAASLAFAWRIRKERPRVRLVLASVYPRSEATEQLRPDAYLVKPFGLAELGRALSAV
jgi:two-component SAPR family response regulator